MESHTVIIKPLITEKTMGNAKKNSFTFAVAPKATKEMVKKAVQDKFNVSVLSVSTAIVKGKTKKVGARKTEVKNSVWKRATVIVKDGEKISIFELGA